MRADETKEIAEGLFKLSIEHGRLRAENERLRDEVAYLRGLLDKQSKEDAQK